MSTLLKDVLTNEQARENVDQINLSSDAFQPWAD